MQLRHHPSPGFGDLLPGFFVVPQNPLSQKAGYIPTIGDLLPSRFAVPQNPLIAAIRNNLSGLSGCGCGGGSGDDTSDTGFINGVAIPGVGGVMDAFSSVNWMTVAIAVGAVVLMNRSKGRR